MRAPPARPGGEAADGARPREAPPISRPAPGTAARPSPLPPASTPPSSPPAKSRSAARRAAALSYVLRLQSDREAAAGAYRELWEAPRDAIPEIILEVANEEPSSLNELTVLVLDKDGFARLNEAGESFAYDIPGLRNVKYDDIVVGKASRGAKVILRSLKKPFPVGAVLRAALLNRFRSTDYPPGDDAKDPVGWWQRFHDKVRAKL